MAKTITLIIQIAFLIIPLIFLGAGLLKGRKFKWQFSLSKIIIIAVSALLSALVAAAVSNAVSHLVIGMVPINDLLGEYADLIEEVASAEGLVCAFASMLVAPVIYLPIFFIIRGILGLINRLGLTRLYLKQNEGEKNRLRSSGKNLIGLGVGALCGLVLCVAIMLPTVGTLSVVGKMSHVIADSTEDAELSQAIEEVTDAAEVNTTSVLVTALGGKSVYNLMTSYNVLGTRVSLMKEAEFLASVEDVAFSFVAENASDKEKADAVRTFSDSFSRSDAFPMLVIDIVETAQHDWNQGRAFCGIEKPSLGEEGGVADILMECIERSSRETIKDDVDDVAEVLAILIESDGLESIQNDPVSFLENKETTAKILEVCLGNGRLYPAVDDICDFGVLELFKSFGAYESKEAAYLELIAEVKASASLEGEAVNEAVEKTIRKHGLEYDKTAVAEAELAGKTGDGLVEWLSANIVSSEADFAAKTSIVTSNEITDGEPVLTDPHAESLAIAQVLSNVVELIGKMEDPDMSTSTLVKGLGPVLDATASTETFGFDKTALFLKGILQSEKVYTEVGFTMLEATVITDKIIDGARKSGFTPMLLSLGQVVDVVTAASGSSDIKDVVDVLVNDLTPESAEVIGSVMTSDTLKNYGVPEESAEAASGMLSDMLINLSEKKEGMDEEALAKETDAVKDMVNIMMDSSSSGGTFGADGAIGGDIDKYVDNIIGSEVVSETIIDAVYGDSDTPTVDPLNTGRELSDEEISGVEDYLNDKWNSMSAEEKQNVDMEKLLVSIGAMINANVTVTPDGVQVTN